MPPPVATPSFSSSASSSPSVAGSSFAGSSFASSVSRAASATGSFLVDNAISVLVVLLVVVVVIVVVVYLVRRYGGGDDVALTDTGSKVVLPRSDEVDMAAYTGPSTTPSPSSVSSSSSSSSSPSFSAKANTVPRFAPTPVPRPDPNAVSPDDQEVFNISNNIYTYEDAPAVCKAFGAKLATAKQVEQAYQNGADWCNYGWTQGQYALYPTQAATVERLKSIKGHQHDCGMVGVNGGYFQNPNLEFGVNCYGKKPEPRVDEKALIGYFPDYLSEKQRRMQEKVEEIKQNMGDITVSPFNRTEWDENRTVLEQVEDWVREV